MQRSLALLGAWGGVAIGASTQHFQASARRTWELEDSQRERRREAYAQYISTVDEYQAAVTEHLALLAMSAPDETQRSKRQEIRGIGQRLRLMGGPLSMLASDLVDVQIATFSAVLGYYHMEQTADEKGGLDMEWLNWLASERTNLICAMRDDLAGEHLRRSRIGRLFSGPATPSRQRARAPVPGSLLRRAGEGANPQA